VKNVGERVGECLDLMKITRTRDREGWHSSATGREAKEESLKGTGKHFQKDTPGEQHFQLHGRLGRRDAHIGR
jgi:hypothetical protein